VRTLILALLLWLPLTALAEPAPRQAVGLWTSQAGETQDAFIGRVAAAVYPVTAHTGFEVCGVLQVATDGQGFALPMFTDGSHIACREAAVVLPGYTATAMTLHTHPREASFRPNAQDIALLPAYGANPQLRYPVDGDGFSARDLAAGPGCVVASGAHPFGSPHLLCQAGAGTVRELGTLGSYPATALAADPGMDVALLTAQAVQGDAPPGH